MSAFPPLSAPLVGSASAPTDTSRLGTKSNLDEAAAKFEAIFITTMLRSARAAKLGDGLFDSDAVEQFRDMQDVNVAETMARHMPLGIGKALKEFLTRNQPELAGKAPE